MTKKDKEFRLCYVDNNIMYFTDNFESQWGDDWNDEPYEHNAGEPYGLDDDKPIREGHGHMRYIAYYSEHEWLKKPCDYGGYNSRYSVVDINKGAIAWLFSDSAGGLMAGATMDEAIEWCRKGKIKWGGLTE